MKAYSRTFILFSLCASLVLAATAWLSFRILSIQANWETALRDAALEENARLALWRTEALMLPALALEESHLPDALDSVARQPRHAQSIAPLFINRYFSLSSTGTHPALVSGGHPLFTLSYGDFAAALPEPVAIESLSGTNSAGLNDPNKVISSVMSEVAVNSKEPNPDNWNDYLNINSQRVTDTNEQRLNLSKQVQMKRNVDEYKTRFDVNTSNAANYVIQRDIRQPVENAPYNPHDVMEDAIDAPIVLSNNNVEAGAAIPQVIQPPMREIVIETKIVETDVFVKIGALKPLIRNGRLFLARRVETNGSQWVQCCELDWQRIRSQLIANTRDILPQNDWALDAPHPGTNYGRQLSSLPVRLVTGQLPPPVGSGWSALEKTLALAWLGILIALIATGVLLGSLIALSERRAAFASAVTHELRTPLTTFRMYSEMLADGMVSEPKRKAYLETLVSESNRLGHLVENVLSYARLERGAGRRELETLPADSLFSRVVARLPDVAARAGMTLDIEPVTSEMTANVNADAGAVEQILFNLVDNACKYGRTEDSSRIRVSSQLRDGRYLITVSDAGPGILPSERARVFQPFLKSAKDAANSAPGVGLGLAISRRLARAMGGDLRLIDPSASDSSAGASFVLELKLAPI